MLYMYIRICIKFVIFTFTIIVTITDMLVCTLFHNPLRLCTPAHVYVHTVFHNLFIVLLMQSVVYFYTL